MSRVSEDIRQQVRERAFDNRCEYCRMPETVTHFSHQVDHIIPPRHGGSNEMSNLAWACFRCNNYKGTDIATYDLDSEEAVFLFNPRQQLWDEHFYCNSEGVIKSKTSIGKATARLLQMNNAQRIEMRHALLKAKLWQLSDD